MAISQIDNAFDKSSASLSSHAVSQVYVLECDTSISKPVSISPPTVPSVPLTSFRDNKELVKMRSQRLPKQCPLPPSLSPSLTKSIEKKNLCGNVKLSLIRESCEFYYNICPNPTPDEYQVMAKTLCDKYPELKNKLPVNGAYWVSEM